MVLCTITLNFVCRSQIFVLDFIPSENALKETDILSPTGFAVFCANFTDGEQTCGGVAMLIESSLFQEHIDLNTELQTVTTRLSLPVRVTVSSLYLLPGVRINIEDVVELWPEHNVADFKERRLADLLKNLNISFLNDGSNTHFCAASGIFSAIDPTIMSTATAPLFE